MRSALWDSFSAPRLCSFYQHNLSDFGQFCQNPEHPPSHPRPAPANRCSIHPRLRSQPAQGSTWRCSDLRCAAIRCAVVRWAERNQQRNRLHQASQPFTSRRDSCLRCDRQCDRDGRTCAISRRPMPDA